MSSEFERAQVWRQMLAAFVSQGFSVQLAVQRADRALAEFDARFPLAPVGRVPAEWPPVADGEDE